MKNSLQNQVRALTLLESVLKVAEKVANQQLDDIKYHPLAIADMIANLDENCTYEDFIYCLKSLVHHELVATNNLLKSVEVNDGFSEFKQ